MSLKTLDDLFKHTLRDIYFAEKQVLKALPKMAAKAVSDDLREAFEHHRDETETQIKNLETIFEQLDLKPRGVKCEAIEGILDEGRDVMAEAVPEALDAGLAASAQAVEHYEIARYGTMVAWAKQLGYKDAVPLLQANLDQEYAADDKLTKLAEKTLNTAAADRSAG